MSVFVSIAFTLLGIIAVLLLAWLLMRKARKQCHFTYMYDEKRLGEVPSKELARQVLRDFDRGDVLLHPMINKGWRSRLEAVARGEEVDPTYFRFSWTDTDEGTR